MIFDPILQALESAGVRYVVVGGVAVVLRGHARLTADLDVVIELTSESAEAALTALGAIGLRPTLPVRAADFADAEIRRGWIRDKGMRVFSLHDPQNPFRHVDLFVEYPLPFEDLWTSATRVAIGDLSVPVASIDHLIAMKTEAGRPRDIEDIEALREIQERERDVR